MYKREVPFFTSFVGRNLILLHSVKTSIADNAMKSTNCCPLCCTSLEVQAYAILQPCQHQICMSCLCRLSFTKKHTEDVKCPQCSKDAISHVPHGFTKQQGAQDSRLEMEEVLHMEPLSRNVYKDPCPKKDPCRFWFNERDKSEERLKKNDGFLYLAQVVTRTDNKKQLETYVSNFDVDGGFRTDEDEAIAATIFSKLHGAVFCNEAATVKATTLRIPQLIDYAVNDQHSALKLLFALANGYELTQVRRDSFLCTESRKNRSKFLACWCAKEMLLQCPAANYNKTTHLQEAVGDMVYSLGGLNKVIDFLSDFRLSCSVSTLRRKGSRKKRAILGDATPGGPFDGNSGTE
jgi:hypothetical protein